MGTQHWYRWIDDTEGGLEAGEQLSPEVEKMDLESLSGDGGMTYGDAVISDGGEGSWNSTAHSPTGRHPRKHVRGGLNVRTQGGRK